MQTDVKQVFYFHADANSVGGFLEDPFRYVRTPSSVSLSPTGGSARAEAREFMTEDGIGARAVLTHVSGRPFSKNGPWTQRVVSVVEGFSLLGRITVDRLVGQIFIEQPAEGEGQRRISFAGSRIENLRIDGKPISPVLNLSLLPQHHRDVDAYNQDTSFNPELPWPALRNEAYLQGEARMRLEDAPAWAHERFGWIAAGGGNQKASFEGYALCSLVNQIDGVTSGRSFAHCIELPNFGRIFLAEAVIFPYSAHLTMLRAELGCKVTGQVSAGSVGSNGSTCPPGLVGN